MRIKVIVLTVDDIDENAHKFLQRFEIDEGFTNRHHQGTLMNAHLEWCSPSKKCRSEQVSCLIGTSHLDRPCFDQLRYTEKPGDLLEDFFLCDFSTFVSPIVLYHVHFLPPHLTDQELVALPWIK